MTGTAHGCRVAAVLSAAALVLAACGDDEAPGVTSGARDGSGTTTTSSAPFTGTTLAVGEVAHVENLDGARLQQVDDGVVRSFETTVEVSELGRADRIGSGDAGYEAEKDAALVVFTINTTHNERSEALEGDVVAAVSVDDKQRELPDFGSDSSSSGSSGDTAHYAVAVPDDRREVTLDLKYNGVVQSFDLLAGKPTGNRPDALYRAKTGTVVYQEALAPSQFSVQVYESSVATYTVTADRVELGYFPVQGTAKPSSDDKGWLTFSISANVEGASTCIAPLSAFTFTAEDGTVYQPTQAASRVDPEPGLIDIPLSLVAFEVPADLSKGKLTVTSPTVTCQVSTATYQQVPATGAATIDVALPES